MRNLLEYAALKLLAMRVGVTGHRAQARPGEHQVPRKMRRSTPEKLARFVLRQRGAQFTPDGTLKLRMKANARRGSAAQAATICWKNWRAGDTSSRRKPRARHRASRSHDVRHVQSCMVDFRRLTDD